jgi:hypothetical protein
MSPGRDLLEIVIIVNNVIIVHFVLTGNHIFDQLLSTKERGHENRLRKYRTGID